MLLVWHLLVINLVNQCLCLHNSFLTFLAFETVQSKNHMRTPNLLVLLNLLALNALFENFEVLVLDLNFLREAFY